MLMTNISGRPELTSEFFFDGICSPYLKNWKEWRTDQRLKEHKPVFTIGLNLFLFLAVVHGFASVHIFPFAFS